VNPFASIRFSSGCVIDAAKMIRVEPAVGAATITGDASNTCPAETVTLTATASGATTYTWYRNGYQVQSGTKTTYTAVISASYTVQGKNANCTGIVSASKTVTIGCCPNCADWTKCDGFTQISNVTYEGTGAMTSRNDAISTCSNKGSSWRLPTIDELTCMCEHKYSLPGSYMGGSYWSSTERHNGYYGVYLGFSSYFSACYGFNYPHEGIDTDNKGSYVKCVK
jgi:hypothetical protein